MSLVHYRDQLPFPSGICGAGWRDGKDDNGNDIRAARSEERVDCPNCLRSLNPGYAVARHGKVTALFKPNELTGLVERRRAAGAGPGHHVLVTVDPARNRGSASVSRRMVPLYAPIGLLVAGDTEATVREEYDLTDGEVRLVAALAEDVRGFLAEREDDAPPEADACRPVQVEVDGEPEVIRVHAAEPMSEEARAAFGEVVSAARRHVAAANPHLGVIQELLAAVRIARWCIPDGTVHTRFGVYAGAEVKKRLQDAGQAAREAMTP